MSSTRPCGIGISLITSPSLTAMSGPSASTPGSTKSSTLWAHLLNKDTTASGSGLKTGLALTGLTASAPTDKTGTSVRILLHDTQATIEKFSERVDRLVSEAEESRQKLLARNEEMSDEVERLVRRVIQEQGTSLLFGTAPGSFLSPETWPSVRILSKLCAYIDQYSIISGPSGSYTPIMHSGTCPSLRSRRAAAVHFKLLGCFESKGRDCSKRMHHNFAISKCPARRS